MPRSSRGKARRGARSGLQSHDFNAKEAPPPPQVEDVDAEAVLKEESDEEVIQPPPPPEVPGTEGTAVVDPEPVPVRPDVSDDIKRLFGLGTNDGDGNVSGVVEDVDAKESVQPGPPADAGGESEGDGAGIPVDSVQPGQPVPPDVPEREGSSAVDVSDADGISGPNGGGTKCEGNGSGDAGKKPRGKRPRRSWPPDDPAERDAWFDKDLKALDKKAADLGKTLLLIDLEDADELKKECTPVEQILHDLADLELLAESVRENVGRLAKAPEEPCYTLSDLRGMSLAELAKLLEG